MGHLVAMALMVLSTANNVKLIIRYDITGTTNVRTWCGGGGYGGLWFGPDPGGPGGVGYLCG